MLKVSKILIGALVLALFALWALPLLAHDHNRPDDTTWYKSLIAPDGSPCCDGKDAVAVENWESRQGHYRVKLKDERTGIEGWVDVPDSAVVKGPNYSGHALAWPIFREGLPSVRCFMPGEGI